MKHETFPNMDESCTRNTPRAEVVLLCEVRQGTRPWAMARLEDLSQTGFRIAWLPNCNSKLPLRIRIPGLNLLTANVMRQEGKSVGCAFTSPLHIAVFEHIVRRAHLAD